MNADVLNKLPRYITGPLAEMWGPMPEGFTITNKDAIFVRLRDVEALVCAVAPAPAPNQFRSVGHGSAALRLLARENGWVLHARGCDGTFSPGWGGDFPGTEYFIKKEVTDA